MARRTDRCEVSAASVRTRPLSDVRQLSQYIVIVFHRIGRIRGTECKPVIRRDAAQSVIPNLLPLALEIILIRELAQRIVFCPIGLAQRQPDADLPPELIETVRSGPSLGVLHAVLPRVLVVKIRPSGLRRAAALG